jgi:hypothetical protein
VKIREDLRVHDISKQGEVIVMRKTLIMGLAAVLCLAIIGAFSGCAQKANPGNSENDLTDSVNSPIDAVTDSIVGTWVAYAHINETGEKEILDDTSNETGDILERFVFNEDGHFTKIKFNGNTSEGIYRKAIDEDYAEYYGENVRPDFLCGYALEFIENPYPYEKGEIELADYDSDNDELLIPPYIYKRTVESA